MCLRDRSCPSAAGCGEVWLGRGSANRWHAVEARVEVGSRYWQFAVATWALLSVLRSFVSGGSSCPSASI